MVSSKKSNFVKIKKDLLAEILEGQKKILEGQKKILKEETKIQTLEKQDLEVDKLSEKEQFEKLKELESLEKDIKLSITNPLKNITKMDAAKGFVGAFFGTIGHFAFYKGLEISTTLSVLQSTILYLVSIFILVIALYFSGFRKIEKNTIIKFMPIRTLLLFSVSVLTIILVYILFGRITFESSFIEIYQSVSSVIILAVLGAATADLIGKNH